MVAHQRRQRRRDAGIGNVGHVDGGRVLEHFDRDMRGAGGARACDGQLAGPGARRIHEIGQHAVGRSAVDHDDLRGRREIADRLEAQQWIIIELAQVRSDHKRIGHDQQRVAVGRRARHRFGPDHRARAGTVLDDHRHRLRAANVVRQHAGQDVGATPGGKGNDDLDRSFRLRPYAVAGQRKQYRRDKRCQQAREHHHPISHGR